MSFTSWFTPQAQAFGQNYTPRVYINTYTQNNNSLILYYEIHQVFVEDSRGIFLTLPKNQDGLWSSYEVLSVSKSEPRDPLRNIREEFDKCTRDLEGKCILNEPSLQYSPEPYNVIQEWNELRLRVGEEGKILEKAEHVYKISLRANFDEKNLYNYVLLQDWEDNLQSLRVSVNGQEVCGTKFATCDASSQTTVQLNPTKSPVSSLNKVILNIWPILLTAALLYVLFVLIWFFYARENRPFKRATNKPYFEPPKDVLPWQAEFLIQEGMVELKNTLLSYILWLNHQKYIHLELNLKQETTSEDNLEQENKTDESEVQIEILRDLPKGLLPEIFNKTVEEIAKLDFDEGLQTSKINPTEHTGQLNKAIRKQLQPYYQLRTLSSPMGWSFGVLFFLFLTISFTFGLIQNYLLIGNSFLLLSFLMLAISFPGLYLLFRLWGRLSAQGITAREQSLGYRYYLEKAEQFKLDFSNNPKEGVQKYLIGVPFAAAFGFLPKFQDYISDLLPNSVQAETSLYNNLITTYSAASFYTPPSQSSGGLSSGSSGGFSGGGGSW